MAPFYQVIHHHAKQPAQESRTRAVLLEAAAGHVAKTRGTDPPQRMLSGLPRRAGRIRRRSGQDGALRSYLRLVADLGNGVSSNPI